MERRFVTDILTVGSAPVAFNEVEHGTYLGVCPWCAEDLHLVEAKTFGELYVKLSDVMQLHMPTCSHRATPATLENMKVRTT